MAVPRVRSNHRESSTFANIASIWGLFVGLIGFSVTIYTLFETQRVARKAQREVQAATLEAQQAIQKAAREAQEAVKNVQEQTRLVLERVRHVVREAERPLCARSSRSQPLMRELPLWPSMSPSRANTNFPETRKGMTPAGMLTGRRSRLASASDNMRALSSLTARPVELLARCSWLPRCVANLVSQEELARLVGSTG